MHDIGNGVWYLHTRVSVFLPLLAPFILGMSVGMPVNVTQRRCGGFVKCGMNNQMCVPILHVNKINKSKQFIVFCFRENTSVLQNDINICSLSQVVTGKKNQGN